MTDGELLRVDALTKSFGPTVALHDVSLSIAAGEGLAVVGENGAGKSTLMKLLAGAHRPDRGSMRLRGEPYDPHTPAEAITAGVVTVFQEPTFFPALSVTENLFAGQEPRSRFGRIQWAQMRQTAEESLQRFGLSPGLVDHEMRDLTVAQQQLVLIARAFQRRADLLILDEPTSALSDVEAERLFNAIEGWSGEGGSVIYITHRLRELDRVAERVLVLRDGELVGDRPVTAADEGREQDLVELMSQQRGTSDAQYRPVDVDSVRAQHEPVLRVRDLTRHGEFADVDLDVSPGVVTGLYGLVGSGRTELALTLYGARHAERGTVHLDGEEVAFSGTRDAKQAGVMYLPEDRGQQGLFPYLTVRENYSSAVLEQLRRFGLLQLARERDQAEQAITELQIRTSSPEANILTLSGGSQQKVLLGRVLSMAPRVLLLDEPTRGVDVATKREFYQRIRDLSAEGLGVLVISSELQDVLSVADVVEVFHEGHVVDSVAVGDPNARERIVAGAIGSGQDPANSPPAAESQP